ncbi:hypothetical protein BKA69DRAFT_1037072 [Paraphysoderma sedebokerense]|nr:hypothetical protein BKA69DRAFT_1037072 [Paraphysoderma sedebokerense]
MSSISIRPLYRLSGLWKNLNSLVRRSYSAIAYAPCRNLSQHYYLNTQSTRPNFLFNHVHSSTFTRLMSNDVQQSAPTQTRFIKAELDDITYERVAEDTLNELLSQFEELDALINGQTEEIEMDITFANGVLTLKFPDRGTFVINKQPPNKQIWLSSPITGPKRYDFDQKNGKWFYYRDGETLGELLRREIGELLEKENTVSDLVGDPVL